MTERNDIQRAEHFKKSVETSILRSTCRAEAISTALVQHCTKAMFQLEQMGDERRIFPRRQVSQVSVTHSRRPWTLLLWDATKNVCPQEAVEVLMLKEALESKQKWTLKDLDYSS